MNKSTMFKLMHKINKLFNVFNKYFYILPLISQSLKMISSIGIFKDRKIFKNILLAIELLIIFQFLVGFSIILYITDFSTSINQLFNLYTETIDYIINIFNNFWFKINSYYDSIINYIKDYFANIIGNNEKIPSSIQSEIKIGVKDGIKDAIKEISQDYDYKSESINERLNQMLIVSGSLFLIYIFLFLPGNTETLNEFNSINQVLIQLKCTILDFFNSKPGNPGSPSMLNSPVYSDYFRSGLNISSQISPSVSTYNSSSNGTITQDVLTISQYLDSSVQTVNQYVDSTVQTEIQAITVSKMLEQTIILSKSLNPGEAEVLLNGVNEAIKTITD